MVTLLHGGSCGQRTTGVGTGLRKAGLTQKVLVVVIQREGEDQLVQSGGDGERSPKRPAKRRSPQTVISESVSGGDPT